MFDKDSFLIPLTCLMHTYKSVCTRYVFILLQDNICSLDLVIDKVCNKDLSINAKRFQVFNLSNNMPTVKQISSTYAAVSFSVAKLVKC